MDMPEVHERVVAGAVSSPSHLRRTTEVDAHKDALGWTGSREGMSGCSDPLDSLRVSLYSPPGHGSSQRASGRFVTDEGRHKEVSRVA
jgi:hypothetical protein